MKRLKNKKMWVVGLVLVSVAAIAWANGRVCYGPGIGMDCRAANPNNSTACIGCASFACDANCDHAQDFFLCIGAAIPFCYSKVTMNVPNDKNCTPCGGGKGYPWELGHEPHQPENRPESVLHAHSEGRLMAYYLEKGELTNAHLLVEILALRYQMRSGAKLISKDVKKLQGWRDNPGVDQGLGFHVQCALEEDKKAKHSL